MKNVSSFFNYTGCRKATEVRWNSLHVTPTKHEQHKQPLHQMWHWIRLSDAGPIHVNYSELDGNDAQIRNPVTTPNCVKAGCTSDCFGGSLLYYFQEQTGHVTWRGVTQYYSINSSRLARGGSRSATLLAIKLLFATLQNSNPSILRWHKSNRYHETKNRT
jgi:hypothetical protein